MAEHPYMPLWTDAYLGDTGHLTTLEHGAYLLLLMTAWRSKEKKLADDDKMLARYTRLTSTQWTRVRPILAQFFTVADGWWTQGRLTDEAYLVGQQSRRQSDKAKTRWLKTKEAADAVALPDVCLPHPHPHNTKPIKEIGFVSTPKKDVAGAKRKRPLPDSWELPEAWGLWAEEQGYKPRDVAGMADKFKDHHLSKGTVFADWRAAWRNWVRTDIEFKTNRRKS